GVGCNDGVRSDVRNSDAGLRHRGAAGVSDSSGNGATTLLGFKVERSGGENEAESQEKAKIRSKSKREDPQPNHLTPPSPRQRQSCNRGFLRPEEPLANSHCRASGCTAPVQAKASTPCLLQSGLEFSLPAK